MKPARPPSRNLPPYEAVIPTLQDMAQDYTLRQPQRHCAEAAATCIRLLIDERDTLRAQLQQLAAA